jgi:23S rRNA G2069 N7-methylase RlmK/C1962 C5-methylase RlmI
MKIRLGSLEMPDITLKTRAQAEMFANRLQKRFRHLKKWARRLDTDVFRLYDRDIPEVPLVLDCYGNALAGALYKRPYEKAPEEEQNWIKSMAAAAARALDLEIDNVFIKFREPQRLKSQYKKMRETEITKNVHEKDLRFKVNLSDYLDTGLFPDKRKQRNLIRAETTGKTVLNLFCYTASFSVYAAAGNAASIDSVDLSNTYLEWGIENFRLNKLEGQRVNGEALYRRTALPRFRFIRADVLEFLEAAEKARLHWDLIILDPPVFSNSKKMSGTLDIKRDYERLIAQCLALGERLFFSTSAKGFKLNYELFPGAHICDLTDQMRDEDFTGKRIPSCWMFN